MGLFHHVSINEDTIICQSIVDYSDWSQTKISSSNIMNTSMIHNNFSRTELHRTLFSDNNLSFIDFSYSQLNGVRFNHMNDSSVNHATMGHCREINVNMIDCTGFNINNWRNVFVKGVTLLNGNFIEVDSKVYILIQISSIVEIMSFVQLQYCASSSA